MDHQAARSFILQKLREELPTQRTYHCFEHTLDVYASVIDIALAEGVNGEGLTLLKTAALFHDAGFTEKELEHESAGCAIAREHLPQFGFSAEQVETVCSMIMATKVPQKPKNHLEEIICDADLDYLGRSDFFRIGNTLFEEFKAYGVVSDERSWNELQVRFLEKHRFFTATNQRLREPMKQEHLRAVRAKLDDAG